MFLLHIRIVSYFVLSPIDGKTAAYLINEVLSACAKCAASNEQYIKALADCVGALTCVSLFELPVVEKALDSWGDFSCSKVGLEWFF